ncbi:Pre-mRNA-splicing factor rse1 [Cyberlindnera fabianii]|uniref:Pre-mRNA-splicing factor rse1 n=1 Tax=Cyberlindnera fabianii TaxID=36022 RepID=A0A1V2L8V6_CYBFA|nr:Pre-mRNA-splicing factor rse1 [Cyberlindnera fabianii]
MSFESDICLYNLTLRQRDSSIGSCAGNFSGKKSQEIITATSNRITVLKPDTSTGKLVSLLSKQVFAIIRSISNFKIAGSGKDYLAVTSDAGNFTVLELDLPNNRFITLFNEPYHKSGIRRLSPGNEIAVDPNGRAVLLSAVERNKLVYVMNRDSDNQLTIASPLEANRSKVLAIKTIGLEVNYENPQFASIEVDYGDYEDQNEDVNDFTHSLTFYELDLGLNTVVRKHSETIPQTSNFLLPVPCGPDSGSASGSPGPGGAIVCAANIVLYRNLYGDKISVSIPKTDKQQDEDVYVVAGVTHQMKGGFFFLLQTNFGDIFKVELPPDRTLVISYFDTIPVCTSIIVLKSGFLYADTEYGDKYFYQFEKLGRDETFASSTENYSPEALTFTRSDLENITPIDVIPAINPIFDSVLSTDDTSAKIYAASGINDTASLRLLQYGLPITEVVESDLPGPAHRVWTTRLTRADEHDKYLVISFIDTTLVLSIGENVEEVSDSGLATNEETLQIQQIGRESLAQIHGNGIRIIKDSEVVNEWLPPAGIKITVSASTNRQLAISLSNNELVYFEVDENDRLVEWNERKEMPSRITSLALGEIPEGLIRSPFLVVGDQDKIMRVLSTDPSNVLELVVMQSLSGVPVSTLVCFMNGELCVNLGLDNGVFARTKLDASGQLYETRTKYLGSKPVLLSKCMKNGENVVLAFSNKTWAISDFNTLKISSVLVPPLNSGTMFNSDDCTDGVVGVYKRKLVIFTIDDYANDISLNSLELKSTPKRLTQHGDHLFISDSGKTSHIEKFNTDTNDMDAQIDLAENQKIITTAVVNFESKGESYVLCSVATNYQSSGVFSESFIYTYTMDLELVHKTTLSGIAYSIVAFQGKALLGIKNNLRLYDMGLKQLLCKTTSFLDTVSNIVRIDAQGNRVVVGDLRESVTFLTFNAKLNEFIPFVDDTLPRHITSMKMVDYNTVVGGDKFGNIFLLRCSDEVSRTGEDSTLVRTKDKLYNGAPFKLDNVCHIFIEDIATSFNKGLLSQGGREVITYAGLQGTLGVLIPFLTRSDIKFFKALEKAMRSYVPDLTGRMNLQYRGYYQPVKNVVDGDFVETFNDLDEDLKKKISDEVGKSVGDIMGKIFDVRALSI